MHLIGLLGMLVILVLAWAMSYHRTKVRLRTVAWGIGLQVLFAVIVLRQDAWSFVGMAVFGLMLVVYLLQSDHARLGRGWGATAVLAAAGIGVGFVLVSWLPALLPALLALLVVALLINGKFRLVQPAQRYLAALLVVSGVASLIAGGHHGQDVIAAVSDQVTKFLSLSDYGSKFVFGNLADSRYFFPDSESGWPGFGFQIAFKVLPGTRHYLGTDRGFNDRDLPIKVYDGEPLGLLVDEILAPAPGTADRCASEEPRHGGTRPE
jgi:CNT family concentrative nucleoside transporter